MLCTWVGFFLSSEEELLVLILFLARLNCYYISDTWHRLDLVPYGWDWWNFAKFEWCKSDTKCREGFPSRGTNFKGDSDHQTNPAHPNCQAIQKRQKSNGKIVGGFRTELVSWRRVINFYPFWVPSREKALRPNHETCHISSTYHADYATAFWVRFLHRTRP